jgi:hypothetical protein
MPAGWGNFSLLSANLRGPVEQETVVGCWAYGGTYDYLRGPRVKDALQVSLSLGKHFRLRKISSRPTTSYSPKGLKGLILQLEASDVHVCSSSLLLRLRAAWWW